MLNDTKIIDLKRNNYTQFFPNLFLPQSTDIFNTEINNTETRIKYHQYDGLCNPLSVSIEGGSKVNYIWSYGGQHPVAQILNVDYATMEEIIGALNIASIGVQLNPDKTVIDNLLAPLKASMPSIQIMTFTYYPLGDIKTITDAKGMVTYYEYDEFQRLKVIKDQNGNIVKSYDYHYKL
ncbi:YD repeat-containing protein [Pedobacter sp. AK013]|uniref:RHS repeat domain-containing protein n=1 Tax=Pedobacter sp. AK013 TaxID=2723071 RepID=UPI00161F0716|nr:RHS repeat domain-containing protein [Pedobacter sp. AK013]MBB6236401.1 YD repeat-containing protein [Pedobacter sp. AK013]